MKTCVEDLVLDRIAMNAVSGFDAAAAERAYTELESKASQCDPSVAAWGASAAGLRGILKGTIAPNTSCKPPQAFPDKAALGAALVSCADPQQYACSFPNVLDAWTCTPKAAAGGVCNSDNNCNDGLFCAISGLSGTGTCNDRYAPGVACKAPTQCTSLFCKGGQCVEANQQAAYCLMN
ncbi:MAG: Dickkopf N-terminal cysteine-rich region [Pseudomonadota bacterium]